MAEENAGMSGEEAQKRADRLLYLQRKLAWEIASELAPVQDLGDGSAGGEERERRMVNDLSMLMGRVKEARFEYKKAEEVFSTNLPAVTQQLFTCKRCGNRNTNNTFLDPRNGDTVCMGINGDANCGEILQDHQINRGAAKRNFEDVEDKNHHGPPSDALYPDSVNMRTTFITSAQGKPGKDSKATKLSQISKIAEMDLSNIGHEGRASTRTGYKTQQKLEAFNFMSDMSIKLGIHEAVIEAAKEEFAKFREVKERVEKFKGILCACILLAYEELAHEYDSKVSYDTVRSRDGLSNSTKSYVAVRKDDDVACVTVEGKKVAEWSLDDVKEWMNAVAAKDDASKKLGDVRMTKAVAKHAVEYVAAGTEQGGGAGSKDREAVGIAAKVAAIPDLPFFGTTTSAKRSDNKSLNGVKQTGPAKKALTPGQRFIRLKGRIPDIIKKSGKPCGDKEIDICTKVFDAAMERRLKFEVSLGELERLAKAEAQRLETEEKMNLKGNELKEFLSSYNKKANQEEEVIESDGKQSLGSSASKKKDKEAVESVKEEEEIDPLAELLGDDMPVSSSSGFDAATPSAKTDTKPSKPQKRGRESAESSSGGTKDFKKVKIESAEEEDTAHVVVPKLTIV